MCALASQPSEDIRHLIVELRYAIESFAMEAIFDSIREEDIESWNAILEQIKSACLSSDIAALTENDVKFHEAILSRYGDQDLINIWQPIVLRMLIDYQRHGDLIESYHEHKAILDAIRLKDQPTALAALKTNIQ